MTNRPQKPERSERAFKTLKEKMPELGANGVTLVLFTWQLKLLNDEEIAFIVYDNTLNIKLGVNAEKHLKARAWNLGFSSDDLNSRFPY